MPGSGTQGRGCPLARRAATACPVHEKAGCHAHRPREAEATRIGVRHLPGLAQPCARARISPGRPPSAGPGTRPWPVVGIPSVPREDGAHPLGPTRCAPARRRAPPQAPLDVRPGPTPAGDRRRAGGMSRGVRAPASARSWSPNAASGPDQGVLRQAARDPPRQGPPNADARNRAGRPSARARHADGHTSRPPTPRTLSRATQAEGEPAHRVPTQASNASPVPRETGARVARQVPTPAPTAHRCAPHSRAPPHGVTSVTGLAGDSSACALAIGPAGQHAPDSASASARRRPAPSPRLSASLQAWTSTLCSRRGDSDRAAPAASSSGTVVALASPGADSPSALSLARLPYADSSR